MMENWPLVTTLGISPGKSPGELSLLKGIGHNPRTLAAARPDCGSNIKVETHPVPSAILQENPQVNSLSVVLILLVRGIIH